MTFDFMEKKMTLNQLLSEAEPGTIYKIVVLKDKRIKVTTTWPDGMKVVGTGKTLQKALDTEDGD